MQKVALGMSGGVDSSVAAILLGNEGFNVHGVTMRLFDTSPLEDNALTAESIAAKKVCESLNIDHTQLDLRKEFSDKIVDYFINEYINGGTPNPCVVCNKQIKFGLMQEKAFELGCDYTATGHYAKKFLDGDRALIKKAADITKDQSYMLYSLSQSQIKSALFPLGELTKAQIREIALQQGLESANKKDSQDICFVPSGDYARFITDHTGKEFPEGDFVSPDGKTLGKHKGIINYTNGQRKGLGIALGSPAFVINKNVLDNTVTLSTDENLLFQKFVEIKNTNFIPFDKLSGDLRVKAKLRYRQTEQDAVLHPIDKDRLIIEFSSPQRAAACGQSAVFYDGDILVGGGIIVKGVNSL